MKNSKASRTDLIIMCLVCLFCLMMAGYNNVQINQIDSKVKKSIENHLATTNDSTLNNELMAVYNEE